MNKFYTFFYITGIAVVLGASGILVRANTNFYVSASTTWGADGSGTGADATHPYVAASESTYDWALLHVKTNVNFIYEGGTYKTKGWADLGANNVYPTVQHWGATNATNRTVIQLYQDPASPPPCRHNSGSFVFGGNADRFELHDLTLDCNANNLYNFIHTNCIESYDAINISGSDLVYSNLLIKGFGAQNSKEGFTIYYNPIPYYMGGRTLFSNVTIVDCVFTSPATNNTFNTNNISDPAYWFPGSSTCIGIYPGIGPDGVAAVVTNVVVSRCVVSNVISDFRLGYNKAFMVPKAENCTVVGCERGFYFEPRYGNKINYSGVHSITGCRFSNVWEAVNIACIEPQTNVFGTLVMKSNLVYLNDASQNLALFGGNLGDSAAFENISFDSSATIFGSIVASENVVTNVGSPTGVNYGFVFNAMVPAISNIVVSYNTITTGTGGRALVVKSNAVMYASLYENRAANKSLLPIVDENGVTNATQQRSDFNRDTKADILWHDQLSGSNVVWFLSGTNLLGSNYLSSGLLSSWQVAAVAEFDGDLNDDVVWQSSYQPSNLVWGLAATNWLQSYYWGKTTNGSFQVVAAGRFTESGYNDLVWRDSASGSNRLWIGADTYWLEIPIPARVGSDFTISGTGDFNGDHQTDILWKNETTGVVDVWLMDHTNYVRTAALAPPTSLRSQDKIVAVDDFSGDGEPDILLRDYTSGAVSLWQMTQTNIVASYSLTNLPTMPTTDWYIAGGPSSPATPVRYVATFGSNSNPGAYDLPYRTLQFAASATPSGAAFWAFAGNYSENVTMRSYNVKLRVINGVINLR